MSKFDIEKIRSYFPAMHDVLGLSPPIFLDNPGGTQVPQMVIDAMVDCLIHSNANLGGLFDTSRRAGAIVNEAHEAMADFVNASSAREIIIGQNMTSLTFHIARSIGKMFNEGDEIILTTMEHDANVSPWLLMAKDNGLKVKFLPFNKKTFRFDLMELEDLITDRTKFLAIGHASNMTGTINDVQAMTEIAKKVDALVYVDSVQYAPHGVIDVQDLGCDFLACSPYKFFGPHMGVLWGREELLLEMTPYKLRPASDDLPNRYETGTMNHEGMAGITATIEYFAKIGREDAGEIYLNRYSKSSKRRQAVCAAMDYLADYELPLTQYLIDGLVKLSGVTVQGITNANEINNRVPTVSFTVEGHESCSIARALGDKNIQIWSGHNYAIEPINYLGLMSYGGIVRIGLAHYNTITEIDMVLEAIREYLAA